MSLNSFMYLGRFRTNLLTILFIHTYAIIICLFSSDTLHVRLSYRFRAPILWMLSSLFIINIFFYWIVTHGYSNMNGLKIFNHLVLIFSLCMFFFQMGIFMAKLIDPPIVGKLYFIGGFAPRGLFQRLWRLGEPTHFQFSKTV